VVTRHEKNGMSIALTAAWKIFGVSETVNRHWAQPDFCPTSFVPLQMRPLRTFIRNSSASARDFSIIFELLPCSNSIS
jgi:hypothetical protein